MTGYYNPKNRPLSTREQAMADLMVDGFFVVMHHIEDRRLVMIAGPFKTADDMAAAYTDCDLAMDYSVADLDVYWCGPQQEPKETAA